jgi:Fe-S cluster biogenesis protein NfuA
VTVDRDAVEARLRDVSRLLRTHAGGLAVEDVSDDGTVRVRFTGQCTGCMFRPVTLEATIRPALLDVPGVACVEADGCRVSEEASRRLRRGYW